MELLAAIVGIIIVVILWDVKGPDIMGRRCFHSKLKRTGMCPTCNAYVLMSDAPNVVHVDDLPEPQRSNFKALEKQLRQDTIAQHKSRWN